MQLIQKHWRFMIESFLFLLSACLVFSYSNLFKWPEGPSLYALVAFSIYFVLQFFFKFGLTLPFIFIVTFLIFAIQEWNIHQANKSFELEDYQLAIAFITIALNGAMIYFENKLRW